MCLPTTIEHPAAGGLQISKKCRRKGAKIITTEQDHAAADASTCSLSFSSPSSSSSSSGCSTPDSSSSSSSSSNYPLISRAELEVQAPLGAGTYGSVFRAHWTTLGQNGAHSKQVALKKVFSLDKEVNIISQLRHRNIVQCYGVCSANPDYWIVMEYAEGGSLFDQLHTNHDPDHQHSPPLSTECLIRWAVQIARGVAYLHHEAPLVVIHRDLKSKNIVLGSGGRKHPQCKLCDFGTSKELTGSRTVPSWGGTAAWMSPEIISQHPDGITTATDVWSFAVVLWEMFSREIPYNGLTEFKIYSIISHGVKLVIPDGCPGLLSELLDNCWQTDPKQRPDMKDVLAILERMKTDTDLQMELGHTLILNREWHEQIRHQLDYLEELKLNLARSVEELSRREAIVRLRECSHRNFLHAMDTPHALNNVREWSTDCVCEWVQNIAAGALEDFSEKYVDALVCSILHYGINGARLLQLTERDLDSLGIDTVAVRRYIGVKLDQLRDFNNNTNDNNNGCCLEQSESTDLVHQDQQQQQQQHPTTSADHVEQTMLLHVGMYCRALTREDEEQSASSYRFKVFVDSDWEDIPGGAQSTSAECETIPAAESDLPDSSTLIKEVSFSIVDANQVPLMDPVHCICPPFGHLKWLQWDDAKGQIYDHKLPLFITIVAIFTHEVVEPGNKRIEIKLDAIVSGPRTLCDQRVPMQLKRRPQSSSSPSSACLSRISSLLHLSSPLASIHALNTPQRVTKRHNTTTMTTGSDDGSGGGGSFFLSTPSSRFGSTSSLLLNCSPVWADLAASVRRNPFFLPESGVLRRLPSKVQSKSVSSAIYRIIGGTTVTANDAGYGNGGGPICQRSISADGAKNNKGPAGDDCDGCPAMPTKAGRRKYASETESILEEGGVREREAHLMPV